MNEAGFWNNVKTLLRANKLTQSQLADLCGISYRLITSWINKDILPDAAQSVAIAKALGTTVEYLVTGEDIPPETMESHKDAVRQILDSVKVLADFYNV